MGKVESKFQCTGCQTMKPVIFKKPTMGQVSVVKFDCDNCDSTIECHVTNDRSKPGTVKVQTKMTKPGARFLTSLKANVEKQRREAEEEAAKIEYLPTEHGYEALIGFDADTRQFLAGTRELPDITTEAPTREEAMTQLNEAIQLWKDAGLESGIAMPAPLPRFGTVVEEALPSEDAKHELKYGERLEIGQQAREYEALSVAEATVEDEEPVREMGAVESALDSVIPKAGYAHGNTVAVPPPHQIAQPSANA